MQILDISFLSTFATSIITFFVAGYLYRLWRGQSNRLMTDLPLIFSVSFLFTGGSMFLSSAPGLMIVEYSLALFRVRALFVCLSVMPMLAVILHIWLPRYAQWHRRVMAIIFVYWVVVAAFGPDEATIMSLVIPVLLVFNLAMIVTFAITWKTGRLKEVRSDLLVFGLSLAFVSQGLRVTLLNAGLSVVGDVFNLLMLFIISLALVNPWYKKTPKRVEEPIETVAY
ncbi:MAG: hypothetical protein ACW98Y_12050 [Candidatus Thorarchaeota archaeon]